MSAESRFLGVAVVQAAVVAVLAGIVASFSLSPLPFSGGMLYMGPDASGPAARLSVPLLQGLLFSLAVLYLLIPVAVTGYLWRYSDIDRLQSLLSGAISVFLLPVLALAAAAMLQANATLLVGLLLLVLLLGVGVFAASNRTVNADPNDHVPPTMFLNVVLLCLFVAVFPVAQLGASAVGGDLVETNRYGATAPQAQFDFNYTETDEGSLLRITHDGGDTVAADRLSIVGSGITDHPRANQTRAGRWQGETASPSESARGDTQVVAPGNSTRVGVTDDCKLRLVYTTRGDLRATLGTYECPNTSEQG